MIWRFHFIFLFQQLESIHETNYNSYFRYPFQCGIIKLFHEKKHLNISFFKQRKIIIITMINSPLKIGQKFSYWFAPSPAVTTIGQNKKEKKRYHITNSIKMECRVCPQFGVVSFRYFQPLAYTITSLYFECVYVEDRHDG